MKSIVMMVCGAFCVLGGVMHAALGLPTLHAELAKAGMKSDLAATVSIIWLFMSAATMTFGAILLTCAIRMRKKDYSGLTMARWVAACFVIFNGYAMIATGYDVHFLLFLIVGLLAAFASMPTTSAGAAH